MRGPFYDLHHDDYATYAEGVPSQRVAQRTLMGSAPKYILTPQATTMEAVTQPFNPRYAATRHSQLLPTPIHRQTDKPTNRS